MIKDLLIDDYGYDGEGVGRVDGKVYFVPYGIKGEDVKVKVVKQNKSFCFGRLLQVNEISPKRQEPVCPYFGRCGGCSYQHMSYEDEIGIKTELFKRQLKKIGYLGEIEVVTSQNVYGYRNKIKLFVGEHKVGLKYRASDEICDIDYCPICEDKINKAIKPIKDFVEGNGLYNAIDNIVLRQEGDACLINFILKDKKQINYQGLYLILGQDYGIYQTFQREIKYIFGIKSLNTTEFGLDCSFSPTSFHQVNNQVCEKLYKKVLEEVKGEVINCYSGNGVLSGIIALKNRVVGIEIGEAEHNEAQNLRDKNKLKNLVNIKGDCAKILPNLQGDTLIVDPPRVGLDSKVCSVIKSKKIKKFIYISCNSATLVRDLQRISNFKIKKVYLFDMFPRTGEYECLVVLSK